MVIILVPGPSVLFAIGRALVLGTRAALISVFGNALGVGLQILIVALGLGVLIQQSPRFVFCYQGSWGTHDRLPGAEGYLATQKT